MQQRIRGFVQLFFQRAETAQQFFPLRRDLRPAAITHLISSTILFTGPRTGLFHVKHSLLTFYDIPTESDLKNRASQLADYALHENADSVLIGGAMYLMPFLIFELNKRNIDAYYSFSKRISKDVIQKDGRVKKTIIFKHCGFIRATLPKE